MSPSVKVCLFLIVKSMFSPFWRGKKKGHPFHDCKVILRHPPFSHYNEKPPDPRVRQLMMRYLLCGPQRAGTDRSPAGSVSLVNDHLGEGDLYILFVKEDSDIAPEGPCGGEDIILLRIDNELEDDSAVSELFHSQITGSREI